MAFNALIAQISEWLGAVAVSWLFSLSPRLQKPRIGFVYARRDGITALMLSALIVVLAFVYYSIQPPVLPATVQPAPAPVVDLQQALIVAAMALAAFAVSMVVRKQPLKAIGWNPELFVPALQVGFAIAILTLFLRNRVMTILTHVTSTQLMLLLLALGVALAEETVFRGYIQLRLTWWLGDWPGMLLTALIFTLWHAPTWLNHLPLDTQLILAGLTFVQGLVLGWVMHKSKHVAAPALYRAISIWMNFFG